MQSTNKVTDHTTISVNGQICYNLLCSYLFNIEIKVTLPLCTPSCWPMPQPRQMLRKGHCLYHPDGGDQGTEQGPHAHRGTEGLRSTRGPVKNETRLTKDQGPNEIYEFNGDLMRSLEIKKNFPPLSIVFFFFHKNKYNQNQKKQIPVILGSFP